MTDADLPEGYLSGYSIEARLVRMEVLVNKLCQTTGITTATDRISDAGMGGLLGGRCSGKNIMDEEQKARAEATDRALENMALTLQWDLLSWAHPNIRIVFWMRRAFGWHN